MPQGIWCRRTLSRRRWSRPPLDRAGGQRQSAVRPAGAFVYRKRCPAAFCAAGHRGFSHRPNPETRRNTSALCGGGIPPGLCLCGCGEADFFANSRCRRIFFAENPPHFPALPLFLAAKRKNFSENHPFSAFFAGHTRLYSGSFCENRRRFRKIKWKFSKKFIITLKNE